MVKHTRRLGNNARKMLRRKITRTIPVHRKNYRRLYSRICCGCIQAEYTRNPLIVRSDCFSEMGEHIALLHPLLSSIKRVSAGVVGRIRDVSTNVKMQILQEEFISAILMDMNSQAIGESSAQVERTLNRQKQQQLVISTSPLKIVS
ncbi:unnamed protein product [Cylicocyclus nassatus]|uniref:Uncharacterized protein n=1 Tax=Cylicocyclus nassatus TaxID=53992 RepID=A0AA36HEY9_CYLNA|nr:unnamed protein product [Cylicocyclus nassatus]